MSVSDSTIGTAARRSAGRRTSRATATPLTASISVVIPTLNEAQNLPHVLTRIPAIVDEVVLVDGHSIDATIAIARAVRPDVRVVLQDGRGKGNALACGFRGRYRRHHRDARCRRLDRSGGDPAVRRDAA